MDSPSPSTRTILKGLSPLPSRCSRLTSFLSSKRGTSTVSARIVKFIIFSLIFSKLVYVSRLPFLKTFDRNCHKQPFALPLPFACTWDPPWFWLNLMAFLFRLLCWLFSRCFPVRSSGCGESSHHFFSFRSFLCRFLAHFALCTGQRNSSCNASPSKTLGFWRCNWCTVDSWCQRYSANFGCCSVLFCGRHSWAWGGHYCIVSDGRQVSRERIYGCKKGRFSTANTRP